MRSFFLLIITLLLLALGNCFEAPIQKSEIKKAFLDLSSFDFSGQDIVSLQGEWEFHWNTPPNKILPDTQKKYINLPSHWNGLEYQGNILSGMGHASFRLKIKQPKDLKENLAILIREQDTSYEVYIDGKKVANSGVVGTNAFATNPQVRSSLAVIPNPPPGSDETVIDLYVGNYSHRKGGPWNDIEIAEYSKLLKRITANKLNETILSSILFFVFIFFFALFMSNRDTKQSLGICLFTFVIFLRNVSTGERILLDFIDVPYWIVLRIEYISWFWAAPSLYNYFQIVFPLDFSKKIGRIFYSISILLSICLLAPPVYFTELASIYPAIFILNGIFLFTYLTKSYRANRLQSQPLFIGTAILLLAAVNDTLHAEAIYHTFYIGPFSVVLFVFLQVFTFGKLIKENLDKTTQFALDQQALNSSYSRFVPQEFLFHLGKMDIRDVLLGEQVQKRMSILFADIRSFTEFSETLTPKENFDFLNSYLQRVGPIIRHNGGFIDKFIGDGVMALFPNSANDAIRAAVQIQEAIRIYNGHRANCNYMPIEVGVGIHTGNLTLGILGEHKRMEGTVISDAVNLASRIEGITKLFRSRIVISADTFMEATDELQYDYRLLDKVSIKGKADSVFVVEVLQGYEPEQVKLLVDKKVEYSLALEAYQRKDYEEAIESFSELLANNPKDYVSRLFLERSKEAHLSAQLQNF
ncbi:MAG: adenylate/guanylate cyclase domain-containing protein [Leptospira sp.]|nr:adenylate/guanylate cyclase domain-containing protein [Leptospira sp.]